MPRRSLKFLAVIVTAGIGVAAWTLLVKWAERRGDEWGHVKSYTRGIHD